MKYQQLIERERERLKSIERVFFFLVKKREDRTEIQRPWN